MTGSTPRSLKHQYHLYVEVEIENYKDSIPRSVLLGIGDEAVQSLRQGSQITLTEMMLWEEVDRIITKRLRIPSYATWRKRQMKILAEYRKPEHWGLRPDDALVRELNATPEGNVLVAGTQVEGPVLYLAAHGCAVTALDQDLDAVERVINAAESAGLTERVRGYVADLGDWAPDCKYQAVVCSSAALAGLSEDERARVIDVLQSATLDGGVHLVETIVAAQNAMSLDELKHRYRGWTISVEREIDATRTFLARKGAAA
jgi:hypothetical protein